MTTSDLYVRWLAEQTTAVGRFNFMRRWWGGVGDYCWPFDQHIRGGHFGLKLGTR